MATTIASVRINSISIKEEDKKGFDVIGSYSLISDKGKVLATQNFNGYDEVKVIFPLEAIRQLFKSIEKAVALTIGLEED